MARPAEFDRDEVLERAMDLFWKTGYTATSVTDLVEATNLKPGSLYGAFNNKRDLFLTCIDVYAQRSLALISDIFKQAETPLQGIESFFDFLCQDLEADDIGKSCLLVNTVLELSSEDEAIRSIGAKYLDEIEKLFLAELEKAQQLGEIDKEVEISDISTYLMSSIWGLRVLSCKRPDKSKYRAVIQNILRVLYTSIH
ncbi:MAG: TetR/AcrR family transcriptional regulator [Neptuniibacter sp.]